MTQTALKEAYADILQNEVWNNNNHMVDYCVKKTDYIVELSNGDILAIEKPNIEKSFCFGYSDSPYDTKDYDRANNMVTHAKTNEQYFLSENLKQVDCCIKDLNNDNFKPYARKAYICQNNNSRLIVIEFMPRYKQPSTDDDRYRLLTQEDIERIMQGYTEVRHRFEKRLHAYLKRYGLSKIRTWSYWRDE